MRTALSRGLAIRCTAALLVAACAAGGPRPIAYGKEACAFCRMTVSDPRFGAELVTTRGRVYTFDSIECLASYYLGNRDGVASMWVSAGAGSTALQPAERARYSGTPGHGAGSGSAEPALMPDETGTLDWAAVLALVERERRAPDGSGAPEVQ
ncbi:MAG TPA: hypothetical protein VFU23_10390 [Gemmatimonadales bacterium]|nr:hypothetical protein [Gemmatimonadales bacterium]